MTIFHAAEKVKGSLSCFSFHRKGKTIGSTERLLTLVYLRQGGDDVEAYLTLNRDRGVVTGSVTTEGTAVYLVEHHPKYGQVVFFKKMSKVAQWAKATSIVCYLRRFS